MESYLYEDLYLLERSHFWHISKRRTCLEFIKRYLNKDNPKILDFGCGTGENVLAFSRIGQSFGIDSSKQAIDFCRKKGLKNVYQITDENIPLKEKFDLVSMLDVLEHIDDKKALINVSKVLSEEGRILIAVPAFSWLWSRWDEVLHHKRRYTKASLTRLLEKNGFRVEKSSYMFSFLIVPALVVRAVKSMLPSGEYSSDFKLSSPLVNQIMLKVSDIERWFILNTGVPFGSSIICIAKKI